MGDSKVILEVALPEELLLYFERLNYEKNGNMEIVKTIASGRDELRYDKEIAEYYRQKFIESNAEFNMAINELSKEYLEPEMVEKASVAISFSTGLATFTVKSEHKCGGGSCSC